MLGRAICTTAGPADDLTLYKLVTVEQLEDQDRDGQPEGHRRLRGARSSSLLGEAGAAHERWGEGALGRLDGEGD